MVPSVRSFVHLCGISLTQPAAAPPPPLPAKPPPLPAKPPPLPEKPTAASKQTAAWAWPMILLSVSVMGLVIADMIDDANTPRKSEWQRREEDYKYFEKEHERRERERKWKESVEYQRKTKKKMDEGWKHYHMKNGMVIKREPKKEKKEQEGLE